MRNYQLVQIAPPNYTFTRCFDEVSRLLRLSFASLGRPIPCTANVLAPDRVNILLGYHLIEDPTPLLGTPYIIYQLEQLSDREGWFDDRLLSLLRGAQEIWDYSPENIAFLQARGLDARHLPLHHHEGLCTIPRATEDIDVLFYGSMNPRRKAVLAQLADLRTAVLCNVFGEERDRVIARSRIVLNIHFYEAQVMEQARVSYLLNNGRFVLSETSKNNPYAGMLPAISYPELADACRHYLAHPAEREHAARDAHDAFRARPMVEALQKVLGPTFLPAASFKEPPMVTAEPTLAAPDRPLLHRKNPLNLAKDIPYYQFARNEVIEEIRKHALPASRVIELGCSGGETGRLMKQHLAISYYAGIEIFPPAAARAQAHLDRVYTADFERTPPEDLGLVKDDFDLALALDVLEHLYNPWDALYRLGRLVRPGGHVVMSLPNTQNITVLLGLSGGAFAYERAGLLDATHIRFFTLSSLHELVQGAGLVVRDITATLNPPIDVSQLAPTGNHFTQGKLTLSDLSREEMIRFFTYQYVVIAQRPEAGGP